MVPYMAALLFKPKNNDITLSNKLDCESNNATMLDENTFKVHCYPVPRSKYFFKVPLHISFLILLSKIVKP